MSVATDAVGCSSRSTLVHVTELSENPVNPKPKRLGSQKEIVDEYINENTLKLVCRKDDLSAVAALDIKIDVEKVSCGNFGALLPNLRQLRLSNSYVPAIRELGSEFTKMEVLWMPRCCLSCLDGVSSMKNLSELYLAFNEIVDLSPCVTLANLDILDLEGNLIANKSNLTYLKACSRLSTLTLEGNPIVNTCGGFKAYRELVRKTLPQLRILDDTAVEDSTINKISSYDVTQFDNEWKYINSVLREVGLVSDKRIKSADKNEEQTQSTPATAPAAAATDVAVYPGRPGTAIRPSSAQKRLNSVKEGRMTSPSFQQISSGSLRPASSSSQLIEPEVTPENDGTTSELTTGQVVCGGISGALRTRRGSVRMTDVKPLDAQNTAGENSSKTKKKLIIKKKVAPSKESQTRQEYDHLKATRATIQKQRAEMSDPASLAMLEEEDALEAECEAVLNELADWRKQNLKPQMFHSRKNGAQILKIHPNNTETDAVLISTDSESTLDDRSGASQKSDESRKFSSRGSSSIGAISCAEEGTEKGRNQSDLDEDIPKLHGGDSAPSSALSSRLSCTSAVSSKSVSQSKKGSGSFPVRTPLAYTGIKSRSTTEEMLPGQNLSPQPQSAPSRRPPVRPPFPQLIQTLASNGIGRYSQPNEPPVSGASKFGPPLRAYKPRLGSSTLNDSGSAPQVASGDGNSRANLISASTFPNSTTKFASKLSAGVRPDSNTTRLVTRLSNRTSNLLPSKPSVKRDSF